MSRKTGRPDTTSGIPATGCALIPAIPNQDSLSSGSGGSSAKLLCGVPGANSVSSLRHRADPPSCKSISVSQNESGTTALQQRTKNNLDQREVTNKSLC